MHILNFSNTVEQFSCHLVTLPPGNFEHGFLILGFMLEKGTQNPLQDVLIMCSSDCG